jgi:hypothetical protein
MSFGGTNTEVALIAQYTLLQPQNMTEASQVLDLERPSHGGKCALKHPMYALREMQVYSFLYSVLTSLAKHGRKISSVVVLSEFSDDEHEALPERSPWIPTLITDAFKRFMEPFKRRSGDSHLRGREVFNLDNRPFICP